MCRASGIIPNKLYNIIVITLIIIATPGETELPVELMSGGVDSGL